MENSSLERAGVQTQLQDTSNFYPQSSESLLQVSCSPKRKYLRYSALLCCIVMLGMLCVRVCVLSQVLQTQLQAANVATQIQQQLQGPSSSSTSTTSTHTALSLTTPTSNIPPSASLPAALSAGDLLAQLRQPSASTASQTLSQQSSVVGETGQADHQQSSNTSLLTAQLASALGIETANSPSATGPVSVSGKVRDLPPHV